MKKWSWNRPSSFFLLDPSIISSSQLSFFLYGLSQGARCALLSLLLSLIQHLNLTPPPPMRGATYKQEERDFYFFICLGGSLPFRVQSVWSVGTVNRRHNRSKKCYCKIWTKAWVVFRERASNRPCGIPNPKLPPTFPFEGGRQWDGALQWWGGNRPVRITHSCGGPGYH